MSFGDQSIDGIGAGTYVFVFNDIATGTRASYDDKSVQESYFDWKFTDESSGQRHQERTSAKRGQGSKLRMLAIGLNAGQDLPKDLLQNGQALWDWVMSMRGSRLMVTMGPKEKRPDWIEIKSCMPVDTYQQATAQVPGAPIQAAPGGANAAFAGNATQTAQQPQPQHYAPPQPPQQHIQQPQQQTIQAAQPPQPQAHAQPVMQQTVSHQAPTPAFDDDDIPY